jgi:acetyl-CoA carboxylase biotin carboxyl carrier protein
MKIPNDVTSYCDGVIKKILVEDGAPVEYGQPLFVVRPSDTNGAQN